MLYYYIVHLLYVQKAPFPHAQKAPFPHVQKLYFPHIQKLPFPYISLGPEAYGIMPHERFLRSQGLVHSNSGILSDGTSIFRSPPYPLPGHMNLGPEPDTKVHQWLRRNRYPKPGYSPRQGMSHRNGMANIEHWSGWAQS